MRSPETGLDVLQRMLLALLVCLGYPHPLSLDRKPITCASLRRGGRKGVGILVPMALFSHVTLRPALHISEAV
jgi:hypothetical protein